MRFLIVLLAFVMCGVALATSGMMNVGQLMATKRHASVPPPPTGSFIVTEAGDHILTEASDNLITE